MARYTGPMTRKSRRLGVDLVGGDAAFEKRPYPPGQHGRARPPRAARRGGPSRGRGGGGGGRGGGEGQG